MFSENHPEQRQTFEKGINQDDAPKKVFAQEACGFYIDGHNVQPTSSDNNTGNLERIKGEAIEYPNATNLVGYECMAGMTVNGSIVELWAPPAPGSPSVIRVDGTIVLSSSLLDLRPEFPINWDTKEAGDGSAFAFTTNKPGQPPFEFIVKDLVDNVATQKYFTAFDPKLYQINIQSALDIPVFIEMVNVGGGGGLPIGQYQYQIRYASKAGDVTNWSHPTPMIPVVQSLSNESEQYPWVKTFGGPPNPSSLTAFAPRIRFRVTNLYDYDYIEVKRTPYNKGAGIEFSDNGTIVARVDISAGEISVRDYIDPQESNVSVPLSEQDETRQLAHIDCAGAVRYYDRRLVFSNITVASKVADLEFLEINEKQGFPVIDKLYKAGYNDPWNHTYRRSELRGETVGYGVVPYDCVGNKGFVCKAPGLKNYTFPNRRDPIATETANYSYFGTAKAALTDSTNAVGQTHEVFDLVDRVFKSNQCDFKNIIEKGRVLGATGTKIVSPFGVTQDCNETNEEIENHGANVSAGLVSVSYQPFTPVRQTDPDVTGHNYVVNTKVAKGQVTFGPVVIENSDVKDYRPAGFAPDYYAMGMMISGVDNFPEWAKAFSVVRTESAGRVVAQGLAYYSLIKGKFKAIGNNSLGGKETRKFWLYAPDIENGIVSTETTNDIIDNPQNYNIQFVSPLGFFSEWYSAEDNLAAGQRDRCIDMISYVRMLCDNEGPDSNINPMEFPNMGIPGGDGNNYVAYDKWRQAVTVPNTFSGDPAGGNKVFGITSVSRKAEGRGTYLEVEVDQDVYATVFTGGNSDSHFEDNGLRDWTEPVYVVNIIRSGAQVQDNDLQKYMQTTHYQKLESIIGKSTGAADQVFPLVDERWEDCISAPRSTDYGASTDRYLYIKLPNGTVQKWINITYKSTVQRSTILANISSNVGDVKGVYTHTNIGDRFYEINFDISGFYPPEESLILVRYDKTAPIRVYGGDAFIGESIFAPIDGQSSARDNAAETQFALGIGLPYKDFKINPRYYTIRKAGASVNAIQDKEWFTIGFVRQLCAMFTVESRGGVHLAYNSEYPNQFFPLINYVIRPDRWDVVKNYVDNHVFEDYGDDYGDQEKDNWKWGGFRFLQQWNADYASQPPIAFFSAPQIGFEEKLVFPTATMWSLPGPVNVTNAPGIKTFPANNTFYMDDSTGAIKYLWSATTGAGENLYAVTEGGICMLLTKKSILSDLGNGNLGYMSANSFIGGQYWWSRDIGMPDQTFRAAHEATVNVYQGDVAVAKQALFIVNTDSVYRMMDNNILDIGVNKYYNRIYKSGLSQILSGVETKMSSVYDPYKEQFYLHLDNGGDAKITFAFSQANEMWIGTNSFYFDKFTVNGESTFGHRDMKTYRLNEGDEINGQKIEARFTGAFAPESTKDKEFIRIRVNSNVKPTVIDFYKTYGGMLQTTLSQAAQGQFYLKNYRGFEGYIPRVNINTNISRPRLQGLMLVYEIIYNLAGDFVVEDVTISFKKIV